MLYLVLIFYDPVTSTISHIHSFIYSFILHLLSLSLCETLYISRQSLDHINWVMVEETNHRINKNNSAE